MTHLSDSGTFPDVSPQYHSRNRRRMRQDRAYSGGWTLARETRHLYDGMRVLQERDGGNTPQVTYTRGLDLSGSFARAGGIRGLLNPQAIVGPEPEVPPRFLPPQGF